MRRCVFLDRDGVLNEDRADYVKSWEEWRWVPGALEGAAALAQAGRPLVVISNQACVGKGKKRKGGEGEQEAHHGILLLASC